MAGVRAFDQNDYYDVHAVLAQETLIPTTFLTGVSGIGRVLDPSCDGNDLPPRAKLDLPLWLVPILAARNVATLKLPVVFGTKMQRKMRAGAGIEDLKSRCPYFYDVAGILHTVLTAYGRENELPEFVISTFIARYKEILVQAHAEGSGVRIAKLQALLSVEEQQLFQAGRLSMQLYDQWRAVYKRDMLPRLRAAATKRDIGGRSKLVRN